VAGFGPVTYEVGPHHDPAEQVVEPPRFPRCRMAVCSVTGQKWIAEHQGQVRSDVLAHSAGPVLCQDDFQQGNVLACGEDGKFQLTSLSTSALPARTSTSEPEQR
jgi:hypothetical protein